eukprot:TRINITY_DN590_c0_g1_i2.p2 TRINITY_DN590_c0_g1~~TRINITY_DN590_c0_g1_i2.p2  ORF type:complete len:345 (-),score=30.86 TRINITY_DN590_c0_g1_i2:150-1184(-)
MALLEYLIRAPAFLLSVILLEFSLHAWASVYFRKITDFQNGRNDNFEWSKLMCKVFGIRTYLVGQQELHNKGTVVYLANHRSYSDFFYDQYVTGGRAQFMARRLVVFAFPFFLLAAMTVRAVIVFRRGHIKNKQAFNAWIDELIEKSPCAGIIVFPEGTRNQGLKSLPLKRGMLYYAHSRKLPVQVVITDGKEDIMQEKKWHIGFGRKMKVGYSELIQSSNYENMEDFMEKVQAAWDDVWQKVYKADVTELPELVVNEEYQNYPFQMRLNMLLFTVFCSVFPVGFLYLVCSWCIKLLSLSFPLNLLVFFLLILWIGVSMQNSFLEEAPARKKQREELLEKNKND